MHKKRPVHPDMKVRGLSHRGVAPPEPPYPADGFAVIELLRGRARADEEFEVHTGRPQLHLPRTHCESKAVVIGGASKEPRLDRVLSGKRDCRHRAAKSGDHQGPDGAWKGSPNQRESRYRQTGLLLR